MKLMENIRSRLLFLLRMMKAAKELNKIANIIRAGLVNFIIEDNLRIIYASRSFYELLGYGKADIKKGDPSHITDFIYTGDKAELERIKEQFTKEKINMELSMLTKQGRVIYTMVSGSCEKDKNGRHAVSAVFLDISEQKKMHDMLLVEGERYRIASELSKDILFEYDIIKDEMVFSEKYRDMFGRNPRISTFNKDRDLRLYLVHPDDRGIYLELCNELAEGTRIIEAEIRMKDRLNDYIWCQIMGKAIYDEDKNPIRVIGKYLNIDIQKRELEALEYKATRDPLTGVYNKEVTIKKIDKFISGNRNGEHALMFIDFDDFKQVNDNYGHLVGDRVLMYVIGRIKEFFTEGEIIGRIGGDEFIVFTGNIDADNDIEQKAASLVSALDTIYREDNVSISISGSIGIALYPKDGLHYEQMILCADKALYSVKAHGKNNYLFYGEAI